LWFYKQGQADAVSRFADEQCLFKRFSTTNLPVLGCTTANTTTSIQNESAFGCTTTNTNTSIPPPPPPPHDVTTLPQIPLNVPDATNNKKSPISLSYKICIFLL